MCHRFHRRGPHSIILRRKFSCLIIPRVCMDTLYMQHPPCLVAKYIDNNYTTKDRTLSREMKIQCFLLRDGLFAVRRSIQSFHVICHGNLVKTGKETLCFVGNCTICSPREVIYYAATSGYICHLDLGYQL